MMIRHEMIVPMMTGRMTSGANKIESDVMMFKSNKLIVF